MRASDYLKTVKPDTRLEWRKGRLVGPDSEPPSVAELETLKTRADELLAAAPVPTSKQIQDESHEQYLDYILEDAKGFRLHVADWGKLSQPQRDRIDTRLQALAESTRKKYERISKRGRYGGTYLRVGTVINTELTVQGQTYDNINLAAYIDSTGKNCRTCSDSHDDCLVCSGGTERLDESGEFVYQTEEEVYRVYEPKARQSKIHQRPAHGSRWTPEPHHAYPSRPTQSLPCGSRVAVAASLDSDGTETTRIRYSDPESFPPVLIVDGVPSRPISARTIKRYRRILDESYRVGF